MTQFAFVRRICIAVALVALAACSNKPHGTYVADFSSSNDPNVNLAASLMKLSLTFDENQQVTMNIEALGNTEKVKIDSQYDGDRIVLTKPDDPKKEKLILTVEDENTLHCDQCPDGMPSVWKKKQ